MGWIQGVCENWDPSGCSREENFPRSLSSRHVYSWSSGSFVVFVHCCSVTKSCPTLWDTMDCSIQGFPVLHYLPELAQTHFHWVSDAIQLSLFYYPISSCLQSFPRIGVFSSESAVHIRWPKYCSFCFSIHPSNEYSGLISLRIDWFGLLAKSLLQHHNLKASILWCSTFFMVQLSHQYTITEKP